MPTSREKDSKSPSASASSATSSKPGAYAKRDDSTGRSRKSGGTGRDRKERSSDVSSSSTDRDQNAKTRAKRSSGDGPRNPGAHHASSKGKPSTKKRSDAHSSSIITPGAHMSSGRAEERISRKARHHHDDVDGDRKSSSSAGASTRSSGQSSNPSRIEAKLREVGLGRADDDNDDQMVVENEKPDESNAYQVEAELIEEEDEENENNQSRNQGPAVAVASQGLQDDQDPTEEHSRKKRPWLVIVGIVLVVIVGGALAAVFLTRGGSDETSSEVSVEADDTPMPTTFSSSSPSSSPSTAAPTFLDLYEPPEEDFCRLVSQNRTTAEEREGLEQANFGLGFDVTLTIDGGMTAPQIFTLAKAIQENLAPRLLGCPTDDGSRRNLEENAMIRGIAPQNQRQLNILGRNRYIIADAFVTAKEIERDCTKPDFPEHCHSIFVVLSVFLKDSIRLLDIILLVSEKVDELEDEGADYFNLKKPLRLEYPFFNVQLATIDSLSPTTAPSSMPTNLPSISPSSVPSETPSDTP